VACISVDELGKREGVEMPMTELVRAVLYDGMDPREAGELLMGREARDELHGMGLVVD